MKKLLTLATLASLMFSCSVDPSSDPNSIPERWPINITTNITRATDTAFENGDKVGIFIVNQPNTLKASGNYVDNMGFTYSGKWSSETPIYWQDETTKADFYCYYPYASSLSSIDAYPFTIKADQSTSANYKASDFLWGKTTGVSPTKESVGITVSHLMSNVVIKLVAGSGYTESDMKNASVTICGLKTNSIINLTTGEVSASGSATDITPIAESNYLRALVVPQSVVNADIIKVTIGSTVYKLNQSVEFKAGKQHTCTITVEGKNQGVNIGINGWETDEVDFGGTVE